MGTGHDVVRKFVPLTTNDGTRLMVMTVGIELQIMNTATYEIVYKGKLGNKGKLEKLINGHHIIFDMALTPG